MSKNVLMIVYSNYLTDARVRREAETLAKLNEYQVTVLALQQSNIPHTFEVEGVRVVEVKEKKYDGKNKICYILSYIRFLIRCFLICTARFFSGMVDVVHVHNMPDFLVFAAVIPRLCGRKLLLDIHDSIPETYAAKFDNASSFLFMLLRLEEATSAAFANKVICVNHVQKEKLIDRGIPAEKITVSLNVPDPQWFASDIKGGVLKQNNGAFKMIYHGTIAKRLGVDLVVQTVARLKQEIPELEFHIWGKSGDELDTVEQLSHELDVDSRIHIVRGGVPLEKLSQRLENMDLGIIGNRKDAATELMLPVKMLEYIALGIPVVAPRLRAINRYFDDEMVTYYEPENVNSMAAAVLSLYKDRQRRKNQVLKAGTFLEAFGWQRHKMNLINLYREL